MWYIESWTGARTTRSSSSSYYPHAHSQPTAPHTCAEITTHSSEIMCIDTPTGKSTHIFLTGHRVTHKLLGPSMRKRSKCNEFAHRRRDPSTKSQRTRITRKVLDLETESPSTTSHVQTTRPRHKGIRHTRHAQTERNLTYWIEVTTEIAIRGRFSQQTRI